jgi:hypothetical protein
MVVDRAERLTESLELAVLVERFCQVSRQRPVCGRSGHGEMWRSDERHDETTPVSTGVCVTIPVGATFQFRAAPGGPLAAIAITMPP